MNNFNTRLGLQIGRSFAALFPSDPQYEGRHCITFHNQRDYVFFRHHRYIFKNRQKVGIQELGPRFTLKLRSLQKGTFDSKFGEFEWIRKVRLYFSIYSLIYLTIYLTLSLFLLHRGTKWRPVDENSLFNCNKFKINNNNNEKIIRFLFSFLHKLNCCSCNELRRENFAKKILFLYNIYFFFVDFSSH